MDTMKPDRPDGESTTLIDMHTHFFPSQLVGVLTGRTEPPFVAVDAGLQVMRFGRGRGYPLMQGMVDIETKLDGMARSGITHSVLTPSMPGVDGLGDAAIDAACEVNDGLRDVVASAPDRLSWMATVPMDCPEAVGAELQRSVQLGARGVMIGSNVNGRPLDLDLDAGLFEAAHRLNVPIMMHPVFPLAGEMVAEYQLTSILGFLFDTTTAALRLILAGLFDQYPQLKFIVSHVGSLLPFIVGRIDYLSTERPGGMGSLDVPPSEHLRKLYVDSVCLWPPALRLGVEFFGADHVMFGTDAPHWPMQSGVDTLCATELTLEQEQMVAHGTAAEVLGIVPSW